LNIFSKSIEVLTTRGLYEILISFSKRINKSGGFLKKPSFFVQDILTKLNNSSSIRKLFYYAISSFRGYSM